MRRAVSSSSSGGGGSSKRGSADMEVSVATRSRRQDWGTKRRRKASASLALYRHVKMPVICIERTAVANLSLFSISGFNQNIAAGVGLGPGLGFAFSLNDMAITFGAGTFTFAIPNSNDFTLLFDSYRIDSVDLSLHFTSTADSVGGAPQLSVPTIYAVVDQDDAVAPTNVTTVLQYGTCKPYFFNANTGFIKRRVQTYVAASLFNTALSTGYSPRTRQWVDCDNSAVPQYGLKMCYDAGSQRSAVDTYVGCFQISCKINYSFKNTR